MLSASARSADAVTCLGAAVAEHGRRVTVAPGEFLFTEGDRSVHVYACLHGTIQIVRFPSSGRRLLLGIKQPLDVFGELSALDGAPRSASAVASEASVVARLPADRFAELLADEPALAAAVTQSLAAQVREANERLCTRNSESIAARVGHQLVELSMLVLKHAAAVEPIELTITQRDLADWVGATREATARSLADFRSADLIETGRGRIVVRDVTALTATVNAL